MSSYERQVIPMLGVYLYSVLTASEISDLFISKRYIPRIGGERAPGKRTTWAQVAGVPHIYTMLQVIPSHRWLMLDAHVK